LSAQKAFAAAVALLRITMRADAITSAISFTTNEAECRHAINAY